MAQNKSQKRRALAEMRVVEELLRRWDPIGVRPGEDWPSDEYDCYAPHIVSLVKGGCSHANLTKHLEHLRMDRMGVGKGRRCDSEIANHIIEALRASTD